MDFGDIRQQDKKHKQKGKTNEQNKIKAWQTSLRKLVLKYCKTKFHKPNK
jgi:hypothetical protein